MIELSPMELRRRLSHIDNDLSLGRADKEMVKALGLRYVREGFRGMASDVGLYSNSEVAAACRASLGTVSKLTRRAIAFPSTAVLLRIGRLMRARGLEVAAEELPPDPEVDAMIRRAMKGQSELRQRIIAQRTQQQNLA